MVLLVLMQALVLLVLMVLLVLLVEVSEQLAQSAGTLSQLLVLQSAAHQTSDETRGMTETGTS